MATYTIETPRGHKVTLEADTPEAAMQGAQRWDMEDYASSEAQRMGVSPDLALRVMQQESGANPSARSPKGAMGPMQLMPKTAKGLGVDPADPYQNITGGVTYLKRQLDAFGGDEGRALAAYNAGPGAVRRAGGVPAIPETQNYVASIQRNRAPQVAPTAAQPPPVAAPDRRPTSQTLGFMEGLMPVAEKINHLGNPLDLIPGLDSRPMARQAEAGAKTYLAKREQAQKPGRIGEFAGNVVSTAPIPGGPLVNGALTGAMLSKSHDAQGVMGDALYGAIGGKLGASVIGGAGKALSGVTDEAAQYLAKKGVPLTVGQLSGGAMRGVEDRLSGLPVVGDVIRNAQRRGLEGMNRAAYNDTLAHLGEQLPEGVNVGRDAYTYTKQRISDAYDQVLSPLLLQKDQAWNGALANVKQAAAKLGDPAVKSQVNQILKAEVLSRFDKAGQMTGEQMKAAQEALTGHINDLSKGTKWSRDAAGVLKDAKGALEDMVSRTDAAAGDALANVNRAYAYLKPLETAAAKPSAKDGIFTLGGLNQAVAKGKAKSTLAAGNAPHQTLANAAGKVLPSTVPDSGTAGRLVTALIGGGLLGHSNPVTAPITTPGVLGLLGSAALYSKIGQELLTPLLTKRPAASRAVGQNVRRLALPAGSVGAVALSGSPQ